MAKGDAAGASLSYSGCTYDLTSISWSGYGNDVIETTHLGTTTDRTFTGAAIGNPGTIEISGHFDPTLQPTLGTTATATVTWDTSKTWAASAIMTDFNVTAPGPGDLMGFDATLQCTGNVTITT